MVSMISSVIYLWLVVLEAAFDRGHFYCNCTESGISVLWLRWGRVGFLGCEHVTKCIWEYLILPFSDEQIHFGGFINSNSQTRVRKGIVLVRSAVFSLSNSIFQFLKRYSSRPETEMKTASLRPPHCWWLTCDCPQCSQGTIYAELAFGFLFLVTTKTCVAGSQVNRRSIPGLVSSAGFQVPERTPQRISYGLANPILFHFGLRQPFSLIWVRKYGLHRISTRHKGPELNTQHFGLENWLCYAVCSRSPKKHLSKWQHLVSEVPFLQWLYLCHRVPGQTVCCAMLGPSKKAMWHAGDIAVCGRVRLWALCRRKRQRRYIRNVASESNAQSSLMLLKAVDVPQHLSTPRLGLRENCWVQGLERTREVIYFVYHFPAVVSYMKPSLLSDPGHASKSFMK